MARPFCVGIVLLVIASAGVVRAADEPASAASGADAYAKAVARAIDYLQKAGVAQSVIDYMAQTAPPGPPGGPYPVYPGVGVGVMFGPYWHHWR